MLDTFWLNINDYQVRRDNLFIASHKESCGTGELVSERLLWTYPDGEEKYGNVAYLDTSRYKNSLFNLDFREFKDKKFCQVRFSVPKIYYGKNYHSCDQRQTKQVVEAVGKQLAQVGLECNIEEADLSRVDIAKNIVTSGRFENYTPVFRTLKGYRSNEEVDYGTTYRWSNSQRQVVVYDKLVEMQKHKVNTSGLPKNTMRFEVRWMKSPVSTKMLGVEKCGELLNNFDVLKQGYEADLKRGIFAHEPPSFEVVCQSDIESDFKLFRSITQRNWIGRYLETVGVKELISKSGDIDRLRKLVYDSLRGSHEVKKVLTSRVMKRIQMRLYDTMQLSNSKGSPKRLVDLYSELRDKVLLAA